MTRELNEGGLFGDPPPKPAAWGMAEVIASSLLVAVLIGIPVGLFVFLAALALELLVEG